MDLLGLRATAVISVLCLFGAGCLGASDDEATSDDGGNAATTTSTAPEPEDAEPPSVPRNDPGAERDPPVVKASSPPIELGTDGVVVGCTTPTTPHLIDRFGCPIDAIILVDWEGHLANPAFWFTIVAPEAAYPVQVELAAENPRLMLRQPSIASADGPSKSMDIASAAEAEPIALGIHPDRDALDEVHELTIDITDTAGESWGLAVPILVVDQDEGVATFEPTFPIVIDFSQDQTGFFDDPVARDITLQSAADWAFFLDGEALSTVAANDEATWVNGPATFFSGSTVNNADPYTGLLVYATGNYNPEMRSGGGTGTEGGWQEQGGITTELRRSGSVVSFPHGNYGPVGWHMNMNEDDWWMMTNYVGEVNDFYSIMRHEIGHAFAFDVPHAAFGRYFEQLEMDSPEMIAYNGKPFAMHDGAHFLGFDRVSGRGAFGSDHEDTQMPPGRWITTKTDLVAAQSVGYKLRETSAFTPLHAVAETATAAPGETFSVQVPAGGGTPPYHWTPDFVPTGFTFDASTGILTGTASAPTEFVLGGTVDDQDPLTNPVPTSLSVKIA